MIGGAGDNLSKPSGDRESASLFIPYPPLVNTTPTTSLDLENPSSPNCVEGDEANTSGAFASSDFASSDFAAENPTGDVDNSEEEDAVNGSDSELSDDYGSDVHEELRVVREDLREYKKKQSY